MEVVESSSSSSLSASDRIHQLPGQPQVSYHQFSGYVTVDAKKQKAQVLEAESNPASKPLVIWLNGGPGCSSLGVGAFSENGPFRPSEKALVRNEYSWNRAGAIYFSCTNGLSNSHNIETQVCSLPKKAMLTPQELQNENVPPHLITHKTFSGNRSSFSLLLLSLDAYNNGQVRSSLTFLCFHEIVCACC
ncbi:serine carboxypeptidase-like 45 isoform X1 [Camellia sinensis]|uniref:serine carboxypeptidase-like 45 isoform X1 n=1 Tax=Camellia sinensis TaxID=4442 RepID=UPI0010369E63|nr:serine carboxypeptidase-like 45 isoform X1 [Camellia sinensis]